ncbi:hypothetical protein [Acinetobacter larvae]|uniref:Uncharacterized protein n=1 Tax=Acinetobacter larvae TaxID=1789224 RepID=A0A1B2M082_9GAMM|nr:hypothetical protein [Acinetobacter larvae]AOA58571.1 hypothetical protein BFG52_09540 [Acinetobacter larvae]
MFWVSRFYGQMLVFFTVVMCLVSLLFWVYLNLSASMSVSADHANIRLSDQLATHIQVNRPLAAHAAGTLDTAINFNQPLHIPLKGRYAADLTFATTTIMQVDIDYATTINVQSNMPLETSTDLVYQHKFLPRLSLSMNIPIRLAVPFHLKRRYHLPVRIQFNGPVDFAFDEQLNLAVQQVLHPKLQINDDLVMQQISHFNATMYNVRRDTSANLAMQLQLPLQQIQINQ